MFPIPCQAGRPSFPGREEPVLPHTPYSESKEVSPLSARHCVSFVCWHCVFPAMATDAIRISRMRAIAARCSRYVNPRQGCN